MSTPWRLAQSLTVLRDEINAVSPKRSTASDGTIGDTRHQQEKSEHNPNAAGVVTAMDITHDPAHGVNGDELATYLVNLSKAGDKRIWYVVWDRRICSRTTNWAWRPYRGIDPHTNHLHISTQQTPAAYDNTKPWGWEEEHMPLSEADIQKIAAEAAEAVWDKLIVDRNSPTGEKARAAKLLSVAAQNCPSCKPKP